MLIYILQKLYNRIYVRLFIRQRVYKNIYHIGTGRTKKVKTVLFYFPNATFMNFGDHLFFEPICRLLQQNGMEVSILPLPQMNYYFTRGGFSMGDEKTLDAYDLIISRPDFIGKVKNRKNVILIDIAYAGIDQPLINDIKTKFIDYFKLKYDTPAKPQYIIQNIDCFQKFDLQKDRQYIIYNNYLKSGSFRVSKKQYQKLEAFLLAFSKKHPEYAIIHSGGKIDKVADKKRYPFIDIDLRGKTSIMDLFDICALPNVQYYIGFDALIMHLFFLQNKKAYVLSRGRWTKRETYFLENFIDPPYKVNNIGLIKEYIR